MRRPTDSQLLEIWERGYGRTPVQQSLALLAASDPPLSPDDCLRLSVGQRDGRLLRLRRAVFGDHAVLVSVCPGCSQKVEIALSISTLLLDAEACPTTGCVHADGWQIEFRVPSTGDLLAVEELPPGRRRQALLRCCIESATPGDAAREYRADADGLPESVVAAVVDAMNRADPQANLEFELCCSECEEVWGAPFDVVSLLWRELNNWAYRMLLQIHALAAAYGWDQDKILNLSCWRRQVYLGMAQK